MKTRFAPSPTGLLHEGHVAAMIHVWGLAARKNATVDVRIEDHDRQRCRPEYADQLRMDMEWLGFVPVNGGIWSRQSEREERFETALERLRAQELIYACRCSRKDLSVESDTEPVERRYPGTCRESALTEGPGTCLRVRLPDEMVRFHDGRHGWQTQEPVNQCGDIVVRDRHGNWTYQFAVVVDDFLDEIDGVVRGDDLLSSTGRQLLLARMLGRSQPLAFFHHPLIVNDAGIKLSKRDGAAPVRELRSKGLTAEDVIGQAAWRCGLVAEQKRLAAVDVHELFSHLADQDWLRDGFAF